MEFQYRIMENSDGKFYIEFKQKAWYILDSYETLYDYDSGTDRKKAIYDTLLEAENRVLEEIRSDKYPIVIKEYL